MTAAAAAPNRLPALARRAAGKLKAGRLRPSAARDAARLLGLVRAYGRGAYRGVPWYAVAVAAGALVYLVDPLAAVPDLIPGAGLADDAAVLAAAVIAIRVELARFERWSAGRR